MSHAQRASTKHRIRSRSRSPHRSRKPSSRDLSRYNDHFSRRRNSSSESKTDVKRNEDKSTNNSSRLPLDQENNKRRASNGDKIITNVDTKTALFPSGDNSINRDKDRFHNRGDREVRLERSRLQNQRRRDDQESQDFGFRSSGRSEGILAKEYKRKVQGERRFGLDDPPDVPKSGYFFEHDDRDAPQPSRVRDRIFNRSPERWISGRSDGRHDHDRRSGGRREFRTARRGRQPNSDRGHDRFRRSDRGDRHHLARERSPRLWKHDMFDTINQSPEPEAVEESKQQPKWSSKIIEQGIDDFNIDDLLTMDNPIETMELDV